MKVVTYRITLLEPTLMTAAEGDPNSGVAYEFLPGSALRGAIIARCLRQGKARELDIRDRLVRRLFFEGTTRYLNGYLLDSRGTRTLPTPLSWLRKKGEETPIYDFAVEEPHGNQQWQGLSSPFCTMNGDTVRVVRPDRHISVHTARTRRFGRAMPRKNMKEDDIEGAVYRYDALAAGQTFEAVVICEHDEDTAALFPLLIGEATLGGSRTGGYGRVSFHDPKVAGGDWREVGGSLIPHPDGRVIVTLLSDALTRDQYGQFVVDPEAVRAELATRLKCTLEPKPAFLHGRAVGGFNRKWGLPLPQALAIEMGSVFVFGAVDLPQVRLRELESRGIGERLAEGFGQIAVNWHGEEPKLQVDTTPASPSIATKAIPPGTASEAVARRMVDRMLGQQLDAALTKRASMLAGSIRRPRPSQLSRLRAVIQDALGQPPDEGRERLTVYLDGIRGRQITRWQFTGEPIGGKKTLLEWLQSRVDDTTDIWEELPIRVSELPEVGGVKAALNPQLAYACNLRLVHTVLAFAAKAKQKEERHAGTTLVTQDIA